MKILFLKYYYSISDGSSMALYEYIKENKHIDDYKIISHKISTCQVDVKISEVRNFNDMLKELENGNYDTVHYFKTHGYELFNWLLKSKKRLNLTLPIITTICQRPSYKGMLLSPKEIRKSAKLVFIDKSAYNDKLLSFIPKNAKILNYFGRDKLNIDLTGEILKSNKSNNKEFIIGRGSTLNKCPKDIIEIFDRIKLPNKKLIIVGIPKDSWLHKSVQKRNDIEIIPPVPYEEWLKICVSFDIFWYYIPFSSHSSIDGTLGDAMLLNKPVVYMGPEAPKERFNSQNGFIANNKSDMISYIYKLANNKQLRYEIGKNARISIINNFSLNITISKYNSIYDDRFNLMDINISIPIKYIVYFYKNSIKSLLRSWISGTFIEKYISARH